MTQIDPLEAAAKAVLDCRIQADWFDVDKYGFWLHSHDSELAQAATTAYTKAALERSDVGELVKALTEGQSQERQRYTVCVSKNACNDAAETITALVAEREYNKVCAASIADRDGWVQRAEAAEAERDTLREAMENFANAVEKLAFERPAPNEYTPRFVQVAVGVRQALNPKEASDETSE